MSEPKVTGVNISLDEFTRLIERDLMLEALEQTGVDNWNGYSDAMQLLESWDDDDYEESQDFIEDEDV